MEASGVLGDFLVVTVEEEHFALAKFESSFGSFDEAGAVRGIDFDAILEDTDEV